jgi:hypothetical protein
MDNTTVTKKVVGVFVRARCSLPQTPSGGDALSASKHVVGSQNEKGIE